MLRVLGFCPALCSLAIDTPSTSYWDDSDQRLTYATATSRSIWPYRSNSVGTTSPSASEFVQWMKRHIIAGRPLLVAVRLIKSVTNDATYDHLVPFWGVCSGDLSASAALDSATDGFSFSTDFGVSVLLRSSKDSSQELARGSMAASSTIFSKSAARSNGQ